MPYRDPTYEDPIQHPRYTEISIFMRSAYRETFSGLDLRFVGVSFDGGVTNRTGERHGPREIRNQSSLKRQINQSDTRRSSYDMRYALLQMLGMLGFNLCPTWRVVLTQLRNSL